LQLRLLRIVADLRELSSDIIETWLNPEGKQREAGLLAKHRHRKAEDARGAMLDHHFSIQ
jgi:hypothetical protein